MLAICLTIACSHYIYNGVILHAHPVRGESHNQRNTTGDVATVTMYAYGAPFVQILYLTDLAQKLLSLRIFGYLCAEMAISVRI